MLILVTQARTPRQGISPILANTVMITEAGEGETADYSQALKTLPRSNTHYLSSFPQAKVIHTAKPVSGRWICTSTVYLEGQKIEYLKTALTCSRTVFYSPMIHNLLYCFPTVEYLGQKQ